MSYLNPLPLGDYKERFEQATKSKTSAGDLTSIQDKQALAEILEPHMHRESNHPGDPVRAHPGYLAYVFARMGHPDMTDDEQGYLLLCLSAIFANYSSSHVFGTESDSPDAVRAFAAALLGSSTDLLKKKSSIDDLERYRKYEDKLLGRNGEFTCTALLFNDMNDQLRAKAASGGSLQDIYEATLPPVWR